MSDPTYEFHGTPIAPMNQGGPGSLDRIYHTLKHFFDRQQGWARLPPTNAPTPDAFLEELRTAKVGVGAISEQLTDICWWEAPRYAHVRRAHDLGYLPRYAHLAEQAGPLGERASKWQHIGARRFQAEVGRFLLIGDLGDDGFQFVSAFQSIVIRESRAPGLASKPFAEALRGLRDMLPPFQGREALATQGQFS